MYNLYQGSATSFGSGVKFWIGQVASREVWKESATLADDTDAGKDGGSSDVTYGRVKVRAVGYHDRLEETDLPWATILGNPYIPAGYGMKESTHYLEGGESVIGTWLDGEDEQKPAILHVFYNNKKSKDSTPVLDTGDTTIQHTKKDNEVTEGGETVGKDVATNEPISDKKFKAKGGQGNKGRNSETKRSEGEIKNIPSNGDGDDVKTNAENRFAEQAKKAKVDAISCKRDNSIGQITGALNDFSSLLMGVESFGDTYINKITGMAVDLPYQLDMISKKMAGTFTGMTNDIRNKPFDSVEDKISGFTNSLVPEELKPSFSLGLAGVMDTIYCLFENVINGLKNTISNFLKALIGKFINAPLCAVEQFVGSLLSNIMDKINSAIGPILGGLTATLGGALGSVSSLISKALAGIGLLTKFIGCDEFKCPAPSTFQNGVGSQQGSRDNLGGMMKTVENLSGSVMGALGIPDSASIFKDQGNGTPSSIASLAGGCESNVLRCGPPIIELFGGTPGVGGFGNAVVNEIGQIIGADLTDIGMGYKADNPPYVTFRDSCGDGHGARGRAIVDPAGFISDIIIDYPGYGYMNRYGNVKTVYGTIVDESPNMDSKSVTGQISRIIVSNAGFGYNTDDTITAENGAVLEPVILGGRVIAVNVIEPGTGFNSIPKFTINSETGIGANLKSVLKFTDVTELSKPLDEAEIIQVVNCVAKPLQLPSTAK